MRPEIERGLNVVVHDIDEAALLRLHPSGPTIQLPPDLQRPLLPRSLKGHSFSGTTFHAAVSGGNSSMETRELFLDDLLINWAYEAGQGSPDPARISGASLNLEPRAAARFFAGTEPAVDLSVDGRHLWPVDLSVLDALDSAFDPDLLGGTTIAALPYSSHFSDEWGARGRIRDSDLERTCLDLHFDTPRSLDEAREVLVAAQTLLEAVGGIGLDAVRELWVFSSDPEHPDERVHCEWWSRSVFGEAARSSWMGLRREVGMVGKLDVHSIGGLGGVLSWMRLCHAVPFLVSVLRSEHRALTQDRRTRISTLAIAWEHLAHWLQSTGATKTSTTTDTIVELVEPLLTAGTTFRPLVELSWNTNNEIKHVALRKIRNARTPLRRGDADGHDYLAHFMYATLMIASLKAAGMTAAAQSLTLELEDFGPFGSAWLSLVQAYTK
ncbi:hypothetical protein ACIRCZ_01585 [Leifsonia sp. NPDC102414]|uniref:hypothetical protein n=1 Tax=Leifsonia sp. NPDC102414 TaxID=3364124 RepID=UPI003803EE56